MVEVVVRVKKKKKTIRKVKVACVSQEDVIHSFEEESLEDNNHFIYQRMIPVTILQVVLNEWEVNMMEDIHMMEISHRSKFGSLFTTNMIIVKNYAN
jgi:hypothetical protein